MEKLLSNFSNDSRVWVYQSDRFFSNEEAEEIQNILNDFNLEWSAHGKKLQSLATLHKNLFVVLAVDQSNQEATGCSIDSSVAVIKALNEKFGVDFLNRLIISYLKDDKIELITMANFQSEIEAGQITPETLVYNNMVQNKTELLKNWLVPIKESWHNQLFEVVS